MFENEDLVFRLSTCFFLEKVFFLLSRSTNVGQTRLRLSKQAKQRNRNGLVREIDEKLMLLVTVHFVPENGFLLVTSLACSCEQNFMNVSDSENCGNNKLPKKVVL